MSLVINSNLSSMNAQRQLSQSGAELNASMERLSSGKRINSAADDAAGLSLSTRLTTQVRGLNQAIRNANDGISMLQTAEGAMVENTNILQRMRELAIQSANGIYRDSDRLALNAEYAQLVSEIDRIGSTTSFNGLKVLDGSTSDMELQVGAEDDEQISFNLQQVDSFTLGLVSSDSLLIGDEIAINSDTGLLTHDYDRVFRIDTSLENGTDAVIGNADDDNNNIINDVFKGDSVQTLIDQINNSVEGVLASTSLELISTGVGDGVLELGNTLTLKTFDLDGNQRDFVIGSTSSVSQIVTKINDETEGYLKASLTSDGNLKITSTQAATLSVRDSTGGQATGITDYGISDPDAEKIIFAIKNYWIAESEQLIEEYYGISGQADDITVNLFEDEAYGTLAYVGFTYYPSTGEPVSLSLNIDLADYQNITLPDGDNGTLFSLDRVIAHEMVHAITTSEGLYKNPGLPGWFTEGTSELIHGADDRVVAETSYIDTEAEFQTLFDITKNSGSPQEPGGYSVAYLAAKYLQDAIFDATNGDDGINLIFDELQAGNSLDQAIKNVFTTIAGTGGYSLDTAFVDTGDNWAANGLTDFQDSFRALGFEYYTAAAPFNGTTADTLDLTDSDTGSIAGTDYAPDPTLNGVSLDANGDGNVDKFEILPNDPTAGPTTDFTFVYPDEYNGDYRTVDTRLVLRSLDNTDFAVVQIKASASDPDDFTDINNLGFATNTTFTNTGTPNYIATADQAQEAIGQLDLALDELADRQGELGAVMNRLNFSVNNLASVVENSAAARSRIQDADYATETAKLARAQILQRAGTAMLSQANSEPRQALALLRQA